MERDAVNIAGPAGTAAAPRRRSGALVVVCLLVLAAVVLAVYWPVVTFGFVDWDDWKMAAENPDFLPPMWAKIGHYWVRPFFNLYIPLTYWAYAGLAWISWQIDGQMMPGVFHAANLLLHGITVAWVFLMLRELFEDARAALLGALLFAVHPLAVEPVAWVGSLNTVLAGCMGMAALLLYVRQAKAQAAGRRWQGGYGVATLLLVAALFAKPTAVVAPLFAVVIDRLLIGRPWKRVLGGTIPWLIIAGTFAVVLRFVQTAEEVPLTPVWFRPIVAADALAWYLGRLVLPTHFAMDYGRAPGWLRASGTWAFSGLVPAVGLGWAAWRWRASRVPMAVLLLMIAGVLPLLGLTPFSFQAFSTVADRYFYWSLFGAGVGVAYWIRGRGGWRVYAVAVVVAAFAARSFAQVWTWRDTFTLTAHALQVNPDSAAAMAVRGFAFARAGDFRRAIGLYQRSLALRPGEADIWYNLGNALAVTGRLPEASQAYRSALLVRPDHVQAHFNLGSVLLSLGREAEAGEQFHRAAELDPANPKVQKALAAWRARQAKQGALRSAPIRSPVC